MEMVIAICLLEPMISQWGVSRSQLCCFRRKGSRVVEVSSLIQFYQHRMDLNWLVNLGRKIAVFQ